MSLFQKAIETYDNMEHLAGVDIEGRATLAPVGFISTKGQILITINLDGQFINAEVFKVDAPKIIIPVTEKSSGRSGTGANKIPHPLCEKLKYLDSDNNDSFSAYVDQLEKWVSVCNIPALNAVLKYVKGKTIIKDLAEFKCIPDSLVCWRVLNSGSKDEVWKNKEIQESYRDYYSNLIENNEHNLCYVLGNENVLSEQHLKGVVPLFGNAKIISSNDTSNFTYLGRFLDSGEAVTVSYEASQKAHNALKWLTENEGIYLGDRLFICWNPKGNALPNPVESILSFSNESITSSPAEYKTKLKEIIVGYKSRIQFDDQAIIAVLSAATTGRLAVLYYNELLESDFLEAINRWDETCCFCSYRFGIESPSLNRIVDAAFGIQRNGFIETDSKIIGEQIYRLLLCKINGVVFPNDIMKYAVEKCSNLKILEYDNRERQLFTTCAIIRKYYIDQKKEEIKMALDPNRRDSSYQYGRLLAVLEKAEKDTYENSEKRETNAIRLQQVFIKRPAYASKLIISQLKTAYYPQLSAWKRNYYEKLIGEIMNIISEMDECEFDRPVGETYLLGYYLQKNDFYTKKNTENESEEK